MSSIGKTPSLHEILYILDAMEVAEAYADGPGSRYFTFTMKVDREKLQETVPDWSVDGLPKPRYLMEEVVIQLSRWYRQRTKEEEWVSREGRYGASIESLQTWLKHAMEESKKSENKGGGINAVINTKLYAATILRLDELRQRREAGALYSDASIRREKASKEWMDQEEQRDEMLRRQRKQQEDAEKRDKASQRAYESFYGSGPFSTGNTYDGMADAFRQQAEFLREELFRGYKRGFYSFFEDPWKEYNKTTPPPPAQPGKKPWYEVLGVTVKATKAEIQKAHRALVKKHQPRTSAESEDRARAELMMEINVARDEGLAGVL